MELHGLLVLGGFAAGMINAVAGGGALLTYPLLLAGGVSPLSANATAAFAAWPGALSSAYGYRSHLHSVPRRFYWLLIPCVTGGAIGAIVLRDTSSQTFSRIVPWFILLAVVLLVFQARLQSWLHSRAYRSFKGHHKRILLAAAGLGLLGIALYGGYFGAGLGIIVLAILGLTELRDIQQMNGLKNLAGVAINLVASLLFARYGLIDWTAAPFLLAGMLLGGYAGARYGARLPSKAIRYLVIGIGLLVSGLLYFQS